MNKFNVLIVITALTGLVACILSLRESSSSSKGKLLTGTAFGFIGLSNVLHGLELLRESGNEEE